jgi:hypothetical protein
VALLPRDGGVLPGTLEIKALEGALMRALESLEADAQPPLAWPACPVRGFRWSRIDLLGRLVS